MTTELLNHRTVYTHDQFIRTAMSDIRVAERLKVEGMDLSFIAKITGLPTEQIQGLKGSGLTC